MEAGNYINVGAYQFDRNDEIGQGGLANVYEGHEIDNHKNLVAVKVINTDWESILLFYLELN